MTEPDTPGFNRAARRHARTSTVRPGSVIAEAVVNSSRWLCNVVAKFSSAPDFVIIRIAGSLPEHRVQSQGWRGWLQRRVNAPHESLQVWRERVQLLADDPQVKGIIVTIGDLRA